MDRLRRETDELRGYLGIAARNVELNLNTQIGAIGGEIAVQQAADDPLSTQVTSLQSEVSMMKTDLNFDAAQQQQHAVRQDAQMSELNDMMKTLGGADTSISAAVTAGRSSSSSSSSSSSGGAVAAATMTTVATIGGTTGAGAT